jgi:hypothetical protein
MFGDLVTSRQLRVLGLRLEVMADCLLYGMCKLGGSYADR